MIDFSQRVVMITGASGNLGSTLARRFRAAGATMILVDRHRDTLKRVFPELVDVPDCLLTSCADLTSSDDVDAVIRQGLVAFERIDVLIHTVGGFRSGTPVYETPVDTLDFMFDLNAKTVFITNRAVLPHMIQQRYGKIVNLAARPGLEGRPNMAAYSASKAAVLRLTESISAEVRDFGINVNCVLPGTIDTPRNREEMPDADFSRWVKPDSLADVIMFLASDAARDIHGAAIPVYGRS
ncbi:MAG: SDR family oxidoreductase [Chloroflexi bacterium]|nr:MAG: SDR family oxidoreductase [Chloroflexota bacterium]